MRYSSWYWKPSWLYTDLKHSWKTALLNKIWWVLMVTFPLLPKVDCNKTQIKAWLDTYLKFYCIYIPYITCIFKKDFIFNNSYVGEWCFACGCSALVSKKRSWFPTDSLLAIQLAVDEEQTRVLCKTSRSCELLSHISSQICFQRENIYVLTWQTFSLIYVLIPIYPP